MRTDIIALELKPGEGTVKIGAAIALNLYARSKRGGVDLIPASMATWSSSDNQIGDVTRQGRLTPRRAGAMTVTVSYANQQVRAVFSVVD